MNVAQVYLWIGKAALGAAFIIVLCILLREIKNRCSLDEQSETLSKPHQHLKLFSVYYLITMVILSGVNILLAYPQFCNKYVMAIRGMFILSQLILLTLFQLGRLQYCFSGDQQQTYGYPKCLFIILYTTGFVLIIVGTYGVFGVHVTKGYYGCINKEYDNKALASLIYLIYYAWNFTVLGLYWYKLQKIAKFIKQNKDKKSKQIFNQIYLSLHKILLLTIIYEIMFFVVSVITTMLGAYFTGALYPLVRAISNVIGSVIMYLMIEHNNDSYVKIVSILYQLKICCCCHCLMKDTVEKQQNNIHQHTRNVQKKHISQPKIQQDVIQISVKTEANKSHNSVNDSVNQIIDSDCDVTIYTETIADALPSQNEGSNYLTSSKHNILPETHSRGNSKQILPPLLTIPENGKSVDNQLTECKLMECTHLQRLKNTLDKMNEKCIAVSELLDDYNHLLFNHNDDEQFEIILNMFGYCNIITCNTFIRHHQYRNRKYEQLEPNEVATQQIIDKIHCFYYHSFDLGNRLTIKEQIDLKDNTLDDSLKTNNKYVKLHQILSDKRKLRRNVNAINVDERLNNRYNQLQIINSAQEHNVNKYCFGCEFSYDGTGEELENKEMNQELNMKLIVIPKYSSFKNELLMNEIAQLTIAEFDTEYNKCIHHFTTI
eukprot:88750_1